MKNLDISARQSGCDHQRPGFDSVRDDAMLSGMK
jgi:hypothetical protein